MSLSLVAALALTQTGGADVRLYDRATGATAKVSVDGETLDTLALVRDARVQVPFRPIFERLGATVQWIRENRKVVATKDGRTITLMVGENFAYVTEHRLLDYPPRIVRGRVMVPIRFVSENMGANVRWDRDTRTAHVQTEEIGG